MDKEHMDRLKKWHDVKGANAHPVDECCDRGCNTAADAPYAFAQQERAREGKPDPRVGQAAQGLGGTTAAPQKPALLYAPGHDYTVAEERKMRPVAMGVLAYFPDALLEVALTSFAGNQQHNPGQPLHWAKEKSTDELDALTRHLLDRLKGAKRDTDGVRHLAKAAWRALAALQREIDAEHGSKVWCEHCNTYCASVNGVCDKEQEAKARAAEADYLRRFKETEIAEQIQQNFHTLSVCGTIAAAPDTFWQAIVDVTFNTRGCADALKPRCCYRFDYPVQDVAHRGRRCGRPFGHAGPHAYNYNGYVVVYN